LSSSNRIGAPQLGQFISADISDPPTRIGSILHHGSLGRTAANSRELRDYGASGVEVQVYREREFLYGRRWATRALALEEADEQRGIFARAASSSRSLASTGDAATPTPETILSQGQDCDTYELRATIRICQS
jgi:hypothetical protein